MMASEPKGAPEISVGLGPAEAPSLESKHIQACTLTRGFLFVFLSVTSVASVGAEGLAPLARP